MIYFDNAASTAVHEEVLSTFSTFVQQYYANPSSVHALGQRCAEYEKKARAQIAQLFQVQEHEVIFTSGATEANNLAIKGVAFNYQNRGKHLITTQVEHASVLEAFRQLETCYGFEVTYLPVPKTGMLSLETIEKAIRKDTILVSIMAVNNEVGTIFPFQAIGEMLKNYPKIFFHVDATQAIGKIDFSCKDIDLVSLSAHKLHGFKGSGVLIKKEKIDLLPLFSGGGQEFAMRSGTNNVPYEVSLAKTLRIAFEHQKENLKKVQLLRDYFFQEADKRLYLNMHSNLEGSPYIVNFSVGKKASVVVEALAKAEIYVSTLSACSSKKSSESYVLKAMGFEDKQASNAIRVSFQEKNTQQEIDVFFKTLDQIVQQMKEG